MFSQTAVAPKRRTNGPGAHDRDRYVGDDLPSGAESRMVEEVEGAGGTGIIDAASTRSPRHQRSTDRHRLYVQDDDDYEVITHSTP